MRQVNACYAPDYDHLFASGLYKVLADRKLLLTHREVSEAPETPSAWRVIEPERIPFVSYPFEWSFSQLKAAALTTLAIQAFAVEHGMVLKDASAYNVQFRGAAPVLIDTLSFERWPAGTPWVAYRQFCQQFLAPLALMSATDARLGVLSRVFIDGPPLDLVSRLLPFTSRLHPSLLVHLHLHARAQARHGGRALETRAPTTFSRRSMLGLVDHLRSAIEGLSCKPARSAWVDYYDHTNYSAAAMESKRRTVAASIERQRPEIVWDLGANTGAFSELAAEGGAYAVAVDGDHASVERHVLACQARADARVLPLVMDLTNPSGAIGWDHVERLSLVERGPADLVLALGLIHHLTLANQVPLALAARFFQRIGRALVIEFVPSTDSQAASMLSRMPRAGAAYSREAFEHEFGRFFTIVDATSIPDSERRIYLMHNRASKAAAA